MFDGDAIQAGLQTLTVKGDRLLSCAGADKEAHPACRQLPILFAVRELEELQLIRGADIRSSESGLAQTGRLFFEVEALIDSR